ITLDDVRENKKGSPPFSELVPLAIQQDIIFSAGVFKADRSQDTSYWVIRMINEDFPGADEHVVYQMGNEVNEMHGFDPLGLRKKSKETGVNYGNSHEVLEAYTEMLFAPGVEVVRAVSEDVYGDPDKLFILSGSVANIFDPNSVEWADDFLDYKIKGEYAPSLKGQRAGDLIDALAVHYPLAGANGRQLLDELYDRFIASGKVENLWFTEDHGRRGEGPVAIVARSFRYIDWIGAHQIDPGQTVLCWWGAQFEKAGGTPLDAVTKLGKYTGVSEPLREAYIEKDGVELYLFLVGDVSSPKGILIGVVSGDIRMRVNELKIDLASDLADWAMKTSWVGEWTAYSTVSKPKEKNVAVDAVDGSLVIDLNEVLPEAGLIWLSPGE
ncbi:MAG: hypothetical protein ACQKBT_02570, partial [Puniceicoccales bacterium]